jgi:hypothetical protein
MTNSIFKSYIFQNKFCTSKYQTHVVLEFFGTEKAGLNFFASLHKSTSITNLKFHESVFRMSFEANPERIYETSRVNVNLKFTQVN